MIRLVANPSAPGLGQDFKFEQLLLSPMSRAHNRSQPPDRHGGLGICVHKLTHSIHCHSHCPPARSINPVARVAPIPSAPTHRTCPPPISAIFPVLGQPDATRTRAHTPTGETKKRNLTALTQTRAHTHTVTHSIECERDWTTRAHASDESENAQRARTACAKRTRNNIQFALNTQPRALAFAHAAASYFIYTHTHIKPYPYTKMCDIICSSELCLFFI